MQYNYCECLSISKSHLKSNLQNYASTGLLVEYFFARASIFTAAGAWLTGNNKVAG
jgi:hypothetical protein